MTAPVIVRPPIAQPDLPVYQDWAEFYEQKLAALFTASEDDDRSWCPEWREHPLAVFAVDALWRSWEVLQLNDGTGLATWLVNFAVPTMRELTLERVGAFDGCSPTRHTPTRKPSAMTPATLRNQLF